jgi:uncharacterized protein
MVKKTDQLASQETEPHRDDKSSDDSESGKRGLIDRIRLALYENIVEPLASSKNPPAFDARGVAFGLTVGFLGPMGTHLIALGLLRMVSRFHFGLAFAFTFVTNPLNAIPVYYAYYYFGSLLLGDPVILEFNKFNSLVSPLFDKTYFWEVFSAFGTLGYEILLRWCVSAVILAAVFGPLGFVITYRIQTKRCKRAARRLGVKYEQYLEQLEKNARTHSRK